MDTDVLNERLSAPKVLCNLLDLFIEYFRGKGIIPDVIAFIGKD
ncbi:MAG: hypothetical protein ACFNJO_00705 [Porphyromonas endodontalis]